MRNRKFLWYGHCSILLHYDFFWRVSGSLSDPVLSCIYNKHDFFWQGYVCLRDFADAVRIPWSCERGIASVSKLFVDSVRKPADFLWRRLTYAFPLWGDMDVVCPKSGLTVTYNFGFFLETDAMPTRPRRQEKSCPATAVNSAFQHDNILRGAALYTTIGNILP